ncbi:Circumsporozoite-like 3 [Homarus americanus]|uniref:Circumsporozoite-like 3 n=2 Tax=Homarus americanus TaxID=6706 RepID=A0A8J5TJU5_HOMAM|nr:Circumsporozoite-like 3 [Homarus americanus]
MMRFMSASEEDSQVDGKVSWEAYQAQFELLAEQNGWDDKQCAVQLATSLKGAAMEVLSQLIEERSNYVSLVKEDCYKRKREREQCNTEKSMEKIRCWTCGEDGHFKKNETLKRSLTSEESREDEDKEESRIIPAKDLKDVFFCWSKLSKLAEDYHPDVGSVEKAISVFNDNVMNYFWKNVTRHIPPRTEGVRASKTPELHTERSTVYVRHPTSNFSQLADGVSVEQDPELHRFVLYLTLPSNTMDRAVLGHHPKCYNEAPSCICSSRSPFQLPPASPIGNISLSVEQVRSIYCAPQKRTMEASLLNKDQHQNFDPRNLYGSQPVHRVSQPQPVQSLSSRQPAQNMPLGQTVQNVPHKQPMQGVPHEQNLPFMQTVQGVVVGQPGNVANRQPAQGVVFGQPVHNMTNRQPVQGVVIGQPVHNMTNRQPAQGFVVGQPVHDMANRQPAQGFVVGQPVHNMANRQPAQGVVAGQPVHNMANRQPAQGVVAGQPVHNMANRQPAQGVVAGQPVHNMTNRQPAQGVVAGQPVHNMTNRQPAQGVVVGQPVHNKANRQPVHGVVAGQPAHNMANRQPIQGVVVGQPVYSMANRQPIQGVVVGQPVYSMANRQPIQGVVAGQPVYSMANRQPTQGVAGQPTPNIANRQPIQGVVD